MAVSTRNAETKAGIFLTFCLGLLVAMLFVYGEATRAWRGKRELKVAFTSVGNLRADAVVRYNGLEVGRIRKVRILDLDAKRLERFPTLTDGDLENLPLTEEERSDLRGVARDTLDAEIKKRLLGRTMVLLTLEVLDEGDLKRFHEDDQIRINATIMGEASVEILSGGNRLLARDSDRILLGVSGDIYNDLAKSLNQVKEILVGMGEMVGGGDQSPVTRKITNFEKFTERLEIIADAQAESLPRRWDTLDRAVDDSRERVHAMSLAITNVQPELTESLKATELSMQKTREEYAKSIDEGRQKLKDLQKRLTEEIAAVGEAAKANKGRIPAVIRDAREWSERLKDKVDQIDAAMSSSDRMIFHSIDTTRETFRGLRAAADRFEETTWYLANHPWSAFGRPSPIEGYVLDTTWRRELLKWHYDTLREDIAKTRSQLNAADSSDKARLQRIDQILKEMDNYLREATPDADSKKRGR